MEQVGFSWLCRVLTGSTVLIPETLFFVGDKLESWVVADKTGAISKKTSTKVTNLVSGISYLKTNRLLPGYGDKICYYIFRNRRNILYAN